MLLEQLLETENEAYRETRKMVSVTPGPVSSVEHPTTMTMMLFRSKTIWQRSNITL